MSNKLRRISPSNSLTAVLEAMQANTRRARSIGGPGVRVSRTTRGSIVVARRRSDADDSAIGREARWA